MSQIFIIPDDWSNEGAVSFTDYLKQKSKDNYRSPLGYYLDIFIKANPAQFQFLNDQQKSYLIKELQLCGLLLLEKMKADLQLKKEENIQKIEHQILTCSKYISLLEKNSNLPEGADGMPCKYLGLHLGRWFAERMAEITSGKTKVIKDWMGIVNERRLYWVWGGSLLGTALSLVPDNFYYIQQAKQMSAAPSPYTGCLGWILYYARFAVHLALLLKHTIRHPWMSTEEKDIPWTERFRSQWQQRKFNLINDSVWATANLVTFFWLCGASVKGRSGDLVTICLLAMDLALTVWKYLEAKAQHNQELSAFNQNISQLKEQKNCLTDSSEKQVIQMKIDNLEKLKLKCEIEWKYNQLSYINDISYCAGLLLAFSILTVPFLPIAAPVVFILGIVGTAVCFALTVIYSAIAGGVDIAKTKHARDQALKQFKSLMEEKSFYQMADSNEKKLLYLQLKELKLEEGYQKKQCRYQMISLVRAITIDAIIPALCFAAMLFLPMGIGIAVIGLSLAVALTSKLLVDKLARPDEPEKCMFDEEEYKEFCLPPETPKNTKFLPSFFTKRKEPVCEEEQALLGHIGHH